MRIRVELLTDQTFKEFGWVLGQPLAAPPTLTSAVSDVWLGLTDLMGIGATQGRHVTFLKIHTRPERYDQLEKHDTSAEAFIPLEGQSVLLVVPHECVTADGNPDVARARAFLMDGSAGVLLRRGTWHAVPYNLTDVATYLVLVDDAIIEKEDLHVRLSRLSSLSCLRMCRSSTPLVEFAPGPAEMGDEQATGFILAPRAEGMDARPVRTVALRSAVWTQRQEQI